MWFDESGDGLQGSMVVMVVCCSFWFARDKSVGKAVRGDRRSRSTTDFSATNSFEE